MQNIWFILEKIVYLFFLVLAGILAKRFNLITEKTHEDLSKLLVDIFWPSLIFVSITEKLTRTDILSNLMLPVFAVITCLTGFIVGFFIARALKFQNDKKRVFIYDSIINNYIYMVLPFAVALIPDKGAGYLFIHNAGMILVMWTLGVHILKGGAIEKKSLKNMLSIGLIATILAIVTVLAGLNKYIPKLAFTVLNTTGSAALPIAMIIAGANIYELGKKALKFNLWNIALGTTRLIIIPGILLLFSVFLKKYGHFSRDFLLIFNFVNIMPVSINSIALSIRFKASSQLASEAVVFTHLFCFITLPVYIFFIEKWIL